MTIDSLDADVRANSICPAPTPPINRTTEPEGNPPLIMESKSATPEGILLAALPIPSPDGEDIVRENIELLT